MRLNPIVLLCVALIALAYEIAGAQPNGAPPSPAQSSGILNNEENAAFNWLDSLGVPSLAKAKLIQFTPPVSQATSRAKDYDERGVFGFLIQQNADAITVLTLALERRVEPLRPTTEPDQGIKEIDLRSFARSRIEALRHPPEKFDPWTRFAERISERAELFIIARACAAQGFDDTAHQLFTELAKMPDRKANQQPNRPFRDVVADDFANALIWRYTLHFEDAAIPRRQLLGEMTDFAKSFPDSEYAPQARDMAETLKKMVAEDDAHAKATTHPVEQLTVKERVAELIFQLRDQNGHQYSQPGSCDIFMDARGEKSPAAQLLRMGFDAVPQLIEALDDFRLTRSVGYHRGFYFSHYVLRVSDCAERILARIAARPFYVAHYTAGYMTKDAQAAEIKVQVQAWWKEIQSKGEKQTLMDAVSIGDRNAAYQADALVKKYPADALPALVKGVRNTAGNDVRNSLVDAIGQLPGDAAVPFLLDELKNGPLLSSRVEAATALRRLKRPEAMNVMLELWRTAPVRKIDDWQTEGPQSVAPFLARSGSPTAIDALADGMPRLPARQRAELLDQLDGAVRALRDQQHAAKNPATMPADVNRTLEAIERLLIGAMNDNEEEIGTSGSRNGKSYADPRIGDLAADALNQLWPKNYSFDLEAYRSERDRQRIVIANQWRSAHGQPLIALPASRPSTVTAEQITPLLQAMLESGQDWKHDPSGQKIFALGPDATRFVGNFVASQHLSDADAARYLSLARALSSIVRSVSFTADSVQPDEALRKQIDAMPAKVLTPRGLVNVVTQVLRHPPPQSSGIELSADREDNGGITIAIRLTRKVGEIDPADCHTNERVSSGNQCQHNLSGDCDRTRGSNPEEHKELEAAIANALQADPLSPLEVHWRVVAVSRGN